MKLKRPRVDWERLQALERELGFNLPPSVVPERDKKRAQRSAARRDWIRGKKQPIAKGLRIGIVGIVIGFGFYEGVSALTRQMPPSKLPAHVRVGPNGTFLIPNNDRALGLILCSETYKPEFQSSPEGEVVTCEYGNANSFTYPKSDRWNP